MGQYFDNEKLPSKISSYSCFIRGKKFTFYTDIGVFSRNGLDFGTRLLLENINLDTIGNDILDIGCGYGPVGVFISSYGYHVDMCDVNRRALHLACKNLLVNNTCANVFYSNIYDNINCKYSCIITNPSIRAGKDVVNSIIFGSYDKLINNGFLYIVIKKDMGGKSIILKLKDKFNDVNIIAKKSGYMVICCKK